MPQAAFKEADELRVTLRKGQKLEPGPPLTCCCCSGRGRVPTEQQPREDWGLWDEQLHIWKPLDCEVLEGREGPDLSVSPAPGRVLSTMNELMEV